MIYSGQVSIAQLVGLLFRHRKWHACEHNRIASRSGLQSEAALEALAQHRGAFMAIEALLRRDEPDWGPEREITESFLEMGNEIAGHPPE